MLRPLCDASIPSQPSRNSKRYTPWLLWGIRKQRAKPGRNTTDNRSSALLDFMRPYRSWFHLDMPIPKQGKAGYSK